MPAPHDLQLPKVPAAAGHGAVVVGFSGGLDSTVLLHLLVGNASVRARGLRALHVHHGLHPSADAWAEHCTRACAALGVPLHVVRVSVDADSGLGPEGAARAARHAAFVDALAPGELLALAHHQDDQAETFLLRALRASGSDGLAAMRPLRTLGAGLLWRPLLDIPRARLLAHAREAGLAWVEDPGNARGDADRNHLRLHVLPALRERWPHVGAALARSAVLSADAAELLDADDLAALAGAAGPDAGTLDVASLRALPRPRRARVLRRWVRDAGLPPLPAQGVAAIERDLLAAAASDRLPVFDWCGARVQRWRGLLHAGAARPPLDPDFGAIWDGTGRCTLPGGDALALAPATAVAGAGGASAPDADAAAPPWIVRPRSGGERIMLPGRRHSHALKHVLQDAGVPPWDRARMPLLVGADGAVHAAGDAVVSATLAAWLGRIAMRLVWHRTGDHGRRTGLP